MSQTPSSHWRTIVARRDNLWEAINYLWLKYVGVSEEYELLREKWMFLRHIHPPAIPIGKGSYIFKALDRSISKIERIFKTFGLEKRSLDDYSKFHERDLKFCEIIRQQLFGLVTYVGLLKLAYFQRTVSYEVAHSTGFAYGPEKTIGSEIVYVAADKVTKAYVGCVAMKRRQPSNQPVFRWDSFVTFVPPIQSKGFFGAICTTFPHGLFHVSLSEEQKSQIAPLLMIAHEVAHVSMRDPDRTSQARSEFEGIVSYVFLHARRILTDLIDSGELQQWYKCTHCPWNTFMWSLGNKQAVDFFEEIFADFIAHKIAGPNTIEALFDEAFGSDETKLRASAISGYMHAYGGTEHQRAKSLDFRIDDVNRRRKTTLRRIAAQAHRRISPNHPVLKICPRCQVILGQTVGRCIKNFGDRFPQIIAEFIRPGKEFSIRRREESTITSSLLRGVPQTTVDPRKLLHCYFEAFKRTHHMGHRPRYSVTLHSLAFNES